MLLVGGVVDQHVEPAELFHRALDHAAAEARIAHVAGNGDAAASFGFDRGLRCARVAMLAPVSDRDIGAFALEQYRHRAADSRVAASSARAHAFGPAHAGVARGGGTRWRKAL